MRWKESKNAKVVAERRYGACRAEHISYLQSGGADLCVLISHRMCTYVVTIPSQVTKTEHESMDYTKRREILLWLCEERPKM